MAMHFPTLQLHNLNKAIWVFKRFVCQHRVLIYSYSNIFSPLVFKVANLIFLSGRWCAWYNKEGDGRKHQESIRDHRDHNGFHMPHSLLLLLLLLLSNKLVITDTSIIDNFLISLRPPNILLYQYQWHC